MDMIRSHNGKLWKDGANFRKSPEGKTGLEVMLLIVEKSLSPDLDENQRVIAGPLISDLLQKVILG
jgi:hypothetical protein